MSEVLGHGEKVWQEFYCRHCPADDPKSTDPEKRKTGGHFRVKFNLGYDAELTVKCPKCGHEHSRTVKNGVILDTTGHTSFKDKVYTPLAAWSRDPLTRKAAAAKAKSPKDDFLSELRGDNVIRSGDDLSEAAKVASTPKGAARRGGTFIQLHKPDEPADDSAGDAGPTEERP